LDSEETDLLLCSCRHAADPWLTNKDGKQEAKEDDDEHEAEQHGVRSKPMVSRERPRRLNQGYSA